MAYPRRVGKYLATHPSQKVFGGFSQIWSYAMEFVDEHS
jgi:hypothetical protein